jgi:hypothetical protein
MKLNELYLYIDDVQEDAGIPAEESWDPEVYLLIGDRRVRLTRLEHVNGERGEKPTATFRVFVEDEL